MDAIFRLNYHSRLATRVLLPLHSFRIGNLRQRLYKNVRCVPWKRYLPKGRTFAVNARVSSRHHLFDNTLYVAQHCKDAIIDQWMEAEQPQHRRKQEGAERPNVDPHQPDVRVHVMVQRDEAVISMDTSVKPLHMRGYRKETVEAPLQETMAALILYMADFNSQMMADKEARDGLVFYDPMCGSGTLLAEAAMIATNTAPGFLRESWGFMHLPGFSMKQWSQFKQAQDAKRTPLHDQRVTLVGSDIDAQAIRATATNLASLELSTVITNQDGTFSHDGSNDGKSMGSVHLHNIDFRSFMPTRAPTLLACNAPYGKRLGSVEDLKPLYRSLGDFMKQRCAKPSQGWILTGSTDLVKGIGLRTKRKHIVWNGGIEARLCHFDLH
ncbi:putative RNA methyltransferase slr0064, variant 2 [Balamuthia mandrillaris]